MPDIFAYGTLIEVTVQELNFRTIFRAKARAILTGYKKVDDSVNLGLDRVYSGLIKDGRNSVKGVILEVPDEHIEAMDRYETIGPGLENAYRRIGARVKINEGEQSGQEVNVEVYIKA